MPDPLPDDLLELLSSWLADHTGLYFPRERWPDLNRGVAAGARDLQFSNAEDYTRYLLSSAATKSQVEVIASHLTVGETYFFRDRQSMEALHTQVLPELIRSRRTCGRSLRIWSAGCCTGEEPYSLAILLRQMLPDWKDWNIVILGTDINSNFLGRARLGVYRNWSFRETRPEVQRMFFNNLREDGFEVLPEIRSMVRFELLNLAQEFSCSSLTGTHAIDLILCRNVLMYFSPEQARETVRRLRASLATDGWLLVSPSDASPSIMAGFTPVVFPGAIFYRKGDAPDFSSRPPIDPHPKEEAIPATAVMVPDEAPLEAVAPPAEVAPLMQPFFPIEQARYFYELGDYASSAEILLAALSREPDGAPAMALLARVRANQGALPEALEWCAKAIAAEKLNPRYHYMLGAILEEDGQPIEAAASLKRALYLDQDFVLAHYSLGNLSRREGRTKESIRHFENALRALRACPPEIPLPESEGITPERLAQIIQSAIPPAMADTR
jgi:chemotaxis protein methyltransferase CheR